MATIHEIPSSPGGAAPSNSRSGDAQHESKASKGPAGNHAMAGSFGGRMPSRFSSPLSDKEQDVRQNMLSAYGHMAGNLALTAGTAALIGGLLPPLTGGALTAALLASSFTQVSASVMVNNPSRSASFGASMVMHLAMGASLGFIVPMIPVYALTTAAIATAAVASSLLVTTAFVSPRRFDGLQGPLLAGLLGCLCMSVAEVLLPPRLGLLGNLGLINSALGLAVGVGIIVYDSSRMADEARNRPAQFDAVRQGAHMSTSINYFFHQMLTAILRQEARKSRA